MTEADLFEKYEQGYRKALENTRILLRTKLQLASQRDRWGLAVAVNALEDYIKACSDDSA